MQLHLSWYLQERMFVMIRRWLELTDSLWHRPLTMMPAHALVQDGRFRHDHTSIHSGGSEPRWRDMMVFRKESRADSFQRQISALRQQLSTDQEDDDMYPIVENPTMSSGPFESEPVGSAARSKPVSGENEHVSIVAANSHWNGTMRSEGSLRIMGQVEGELFATDEIYIAEGAAVNARVSAAQVIIAGMVTGTVECSGRLEILPSGHVIGDVTSPTLIVHEGATVEGDLSMRSPVARPA